MTIQLRAGKATDVGMVRENNQDSYLVANPVWAVADGMGGHAGGEVASKVAVDTLEERFGQWAQLPSADDVRRAVQDANRAVWERAREQVELRGMGTTMTVIARVDSDGREVLAVANVGDSRAYLLKANGDFERLTDDHSVAEELMRQGTLTAEEAAVHPRRHMLTRVLGMGPDVEVDVWQIQPHTGERLVLCSDGLSNEVTDSQMAAVLRRLADPQEVCDELVDMAKTNGGNDNITVVVVDVVSAGAAPAAAGDTDDELPDDHTSRDYPTPPEPIPAVADVEPTEQVPVVGPRPEESRPDGGTIDLPAEAASQIAAAAAAAGLSTPPAGPPAAAPAPAAAPVDEDDDPDDGRVRPDRSGVPDDAWITGVAGRDEVIGTAAAQGGRVDVREDPDRDRAEDDWFREDDDEPSFEQRRAMERPRITGRTIAFIVAVLVILGGALGTVAYAARKPWYVRLEDQQLKLVHGRQLLFLRPSVSEFAPVGDDDLAESFEGRLARGVPCSSEERARAYFESVVASIEAQDTPVMSSSTSCREVEVPDPTPSTVPAGGTAGTGGTGGTVTTGGRPTTSVP